MVLKLNVNYILISMIKKRLCVAHYNEDLSWLDKINSDVDIFVYHKKDDIDLQYNDKSIIDSNNFILKNVGRESHTYLKHIIDNYDNLYDLEYFSQGYPKEYPGFADVVNNDNVLEYKQYSSWSRTTISYNANIVKHIIAPNTKDIWYNLFDYHPPKETIIIPHAFIKLDKNTILIHKKEIYEKCLDYFKDGRKNNSYAWSFEYFWALLFNKHHLINSKSKNF